MAPLTSAFARQLAHPSGVGGRAVGWLMDRANQRPTRMALDLLDAQPGERIVDAGCGTGAALAALMKQVPTLRLSGFDPSRAMILAAQRRLSCDVRLIQSRTADAPFAGENFDAVLALNMLYFCDAEGEMIAQLRSLLRPGGRLVAYVTDRSSMQRWGFVRVGLHKLWDEASMRTALADAGFAPEAISVQQRPVTRTIMGLFVHATA